MFYYVMCIYHVIIIMLGELMSVSCKLFFEMCQIFEHASLSRASCDSVKVKKSLGAKSSDYFSALRLWGKPVRG
jgi:hypothetical protein